MAEGTDYQLHRKVERLESILNGVGQQIDMVGNSVNVVHVRQEETRSELVQFRHQFEQFRRAAEQTANVQRAETKIVAVRDELDREFGHHGVVRRSAIGMLQAFDIGLVSDETVRNISEQLMIETPRYWLAPALVALAAWSGNDPELCDKAVAEAYRRAPEKCALFLALITRRQGRLESSVRWLRHYLNTQDPTKLGRDFATVLEAVSQGAFSAAARDMVQEILAGWRDDLLNDSATIAVQVNHWHTEVVAHANGNAAHSYPNLSTVSPEWTALNSSLAGANAHEPLATKYRELLSAELRPSDRLEDAVDDILDSLVKEYDVDELPRRRELAGLEAIIDSDGDLDRAQTVGAMAQAALGSTLDYLTIQTSSALAPEKLGVSRATQRVAVGACADWFRSGHDQHSREYRSMLPNDVHASFHSTHAVLSSSFQLPTWTSSFNRPLGELETSLAQHWDSHMSNWIATLRYNWQRALIAPILVSVAILVLLGAVGNFGVSFVLALIVFGIWALVIRSRHVKAQKTVEAAEKILADAKQQSLHALRASRAELDDWQREYQRKDAQVAGVHTLIDEFRGTQGSATSTFERRTVNAEGWK